MPGDGPVSSCPCRQEPCREDYLTAYLNRADVRKALHVDHDREWVACDDVVWEGYDQDSSDASTEPYYKRLVWSYEYGGSPSWVEVRLKEPIVAIRTIGSNETAWSRIDRSTSPIQSNKRTNDRTNDRTNERTNERTDGRTDA